MASIVTTKLLEALAEIGIDISKKQPSNVKTLATKNKSSATKVGLLAAERDTGGNFGTVLDIFKKEAQFIDGMNDAEQMAFLNNIMDYKEFGGKSIGVSKGIEATDVMKDFKNTQSELKKALEDLNTDKTDLQTSISDLQSTAKTMKNDAEAGLALAEKNLDDFITTGGQPLKAKNDKYLGGSMHEEGQIRTGIRQFLQNELKNGRIKLDAMDTERVMKYFPTLEDDPILVFKKLYGDEAYNKAGSFPGAFEIGEDFNHYEKIFRENMGEDILKVKDKKYVGDGTLTLTDEVKTTTPDEDVPFATGGRASFVGGKLVDEFIAMIVKKEPIEAMKEVNKIIGKKGKYKNLTQKDIDRIVDQTNDHIFQRDPDNLFVGKRFFKDVEIKDPTFDETLPFDNDAEKLAEIKMSNEAYDMEKARGSADDKKRLLTDDEIKYYEAEIGDSETWMMDGTVEEAEKALKDNKEYMADMKREYDAASPAERAEVIGTKKVNEKFNVDNMSVEESLTTMEGLGATQTAERFRLKQKYPGITDSLLDDLINDPDPNNKAKALAVLDEAMTLQKTGKSEDQIIEILKSTPKKEMAKGGRAGYYGGGQAMVEPDLSDIGHGSDALMGRTRLTAPGSQATTSTGLNYLLGEDNDNTRIPFNDGLLVPEPKPYTPDMFEKDSMTLLKGMYGTGKDSNEFLYNEMIKKGNILRNQGVERETVIEIIRNNKDKINAFLETQTGDKKSLAGLAGLADGGPARKGFRGGGSDASTTSFSQSFDNQHGTNTASRANKTVDARQAAGQRDADRTNDIIAANQRAALYQQPAQKQGIFNSIKNNRFLNNPFTRGALRVGAYTYNPALMGTDLRSIMQAKDLYDKTNSMINNPTFEEEDMTLGLVTDQQKGVIDAQGKMGQLTGAFNPDDTFDAAKGVFDKETGTYSLDDKGEKNIFSADRPAEPMTRQEYDAYLKDKGYADGGIAGLRQGYAGGKGVDIARRGFLKFLGGTAAGVAALKMGLVKMLGKESGAVSKKAIDEIIIEGGSGAPTWLQPLVNKALREGTDISKQAIKDGQVVKSLDTPTGKVDVYYDTRTGEIDIDYIGGNTALGESVNMRYVPGVADEGTKGVKPADEFEASEAIPEFQGGNYVDGPDLGFGENMTSNIDDLYSDTSELATLGGEKLLVKDISNTLKKKKVLKEMDNNPQEFAQDMNPDVYYDD